MSAAKSVSVLHASLLVAARQARESGAHERARELEDQARAITDALLSSARAAVARVERALYVRTGPQGTKYRDAAGAMKARRSCSTRPARGTLSSTCTLRS